MVSVIETEARGQNVQAEIQQLEQVQVLKLTKPDQDCIEARLAAIPPEEVRASMQLCYSMVLLKVQKGDMRGAKEWHNTLVNLRGAIPEGSQKRKMLENRIFCAGMVMSQNPSTNLILNLSILAHEHADANYPLAYLSATNKSPSVLRGAKDLSFLSKHYKASASIVAPLLGTLLEDGAKGVIDVGIAEILYEQGDINGASLRLAGAIGVDNPEVVFAALAMMARIGAVDTTAKKPEEILEHLENSVLIGDAAYLRPSLDALKARFAMLTGDRGAVRAWMDSCGINDLEGCAPCRHYQTLTKCKGYLALGEYRDASTLSESLLLSLMEEHRPLDTAECLTVNAIACMLLGSMDIAQRKLEKALLITQEFGYIRVFADFGKQLCTLLAGYRKDNAASQELSARYLERIMDAARTYGMLWPRLFADSAQESQQAESTQATQAELEVLRLLESGKSNRDMASELGISTNTVKFHLKNLYDKLSVSNRTELVSEAKRNGLLS